MTVAASRDIPSEVKRALRVESGFGCCKCGQPFIEYHHIVPFATQPHHRLEDMMALCPIHHHQATVGAADDACQRSWKERPFNIERGFADGQLLIASKVLALEVGTNLLVGRGVRFAVDSEPLLNVRSDGTGRLLLSLSLFDRSDKLRLLVVDNEWLTGEPIPWDLEYGFNSLKLRNTSAGISLAVDARSSPIRVRGEFSKNGQRFQVTPTRLKFGGVAGNVQVQDLGLVGACLTANSRSRVFSFDPVPPLKAAMIVSHADPAERLNMCLTAYEELSRQAGFDASGPCLCGSGSICRECCFRENEVGR